jgi:hypothetical protein
MKHIKLIKDEQLLEQISGGASAVEYGRLSCKMIVARIIAIFRGKTSVGLK